MKEALFNWLGEINKSEQIPSNIKAINFGVFESENGFVLYLIGSEKFSDLDDDWACQVDYEPKNKYLNLPITESKEWNQVQEEIESIVYQYIQNDGFKDSIFRYIDHFTVGFDDGELTKIK